MAEGIRFNPISFTPPTTGIRPPQRTEAADPGAQFNTSDGLQLSGAQPNANTAAAAPTPGQTVTLQVTAEQLASAAFQQTLASLSSSGVQVSISLLSAAEATPAQNTQATARPNLGVSEDLGLVAGGWVPDSYVPPSMNKDNDLGNQRSIGPKYTPGKAAPTYGGD